ncbi:Protein of unknown function [Bacillus cereus]|nr:Protein of unknown function [Bacillus cereus]
MNSYLESLLKQEKVEVEY